MRAPLIVPDTLYPFLENVIVDETGAVDPNLAMMEKVSSLIEDMRPRGSQELLCQLWAQLSLSNGRVDVDVTWSSDEVLDVIFPCAV